MVGNCWGLAVVLGITCEVSPHGGRHRSMGSCVRSVMNGSSPDKRQRANSRLRQCVMCGYV